MPARLSRGEPEFYNLRISERAAREVTVIFVRLSELVSDIYAIGWDTSLRLAISSLATNPRRCSLAPEPFKREVRHLIFPRSGSRRTYRILFTISDEEAHSIESPTVTVLFVRAAVSPIKRSLLRDIESLD